MFITSLPLYAADLPEDGTGENMADWLVVESTFSTIYIDKNMTAGSVSARIDTSFARFDPIENRLFLDRGISEEQILANKIDIIARKAMKVLDMKPEDFHVNIKVYENEIELWAAYERIFREQEGHKAFYIHKYRTVYISYENLGESVLAHEIGHAVIDSYFKILPPEKIRELLACYVDVHLKD
ncbi:MAG: hypothetical protein JW800_00495 [Candidatus Omnitrophica bacterium]|nr:hypothetical protein [Candidatus Omnitrophota bacterium]